MRLFLELGNRILQEELRNLDDSLFNSPHPLSVCEQRIEKEAECQEEFWDNREEFWEFSRRAEPPRKIMASGNKRDPAIDAGIFLSISISLIRRLRHS
jgi:hypothetical protein